MERYIVDGKTSQEDSRRITYDGWTVFANGTPVVFDGCIGNVAGPIN
jgi:hypothetical protein